MIDCLHHSRERDNRHNGLCALGLFDGKPFSGQCIHICLKRWSHLSERRRIEAYYEGEETPGKKTGCATGN